MHYSIIVCEHVLVYSRMLGLCRLAWATLSTVNIWANRTVFHSIILHWPGQRERDTLLWFQDCASWPKSDGKSPFNPLISHSEMLLCCHHYCCASILNAEMACMCCSENRRDGGTGDSAAAAHIGGIPPLWHTYVLSFEGVFKSIKCRHVMPLGIQGHREKELLCLL